LIARWLQANPIRLALVAFLLATAGCGEDNESRQGGVRVVATTTQVSDLVRNVGGRRVRLERLLEPNADPHTYEPRPSDAAALADAALVFRSGGDLDEWLDGVVENAGADARVVTLIDSVRRRPEDPHWWQDPRNTLRAVEAIRDALGDADPGGRAVYRRSARSYAARLRTLDREVAACLRQVPPEQRKIVTTHDALGYFAARYGVEVVGALIPSLSSAAQPSARDTTRLVEQIREENIEAIFPESSLNPKLERAVSREAGASIGDPLWADTLGPEGSSGETYIDSIAANTASLVEGMTGGRRHCRPDA
jgi:zinc/manganese transport system substrate-binding protein